MAWNWEDIKNAGSNILDNAGTWVENTWDSWMNTGEEVVEEFSEFTESFDPSAYFGSVVESLTSSDLVEPLMESTTTYFHDMLTKGFVVIINDILKVFNPTSNYMYTFFGLTGGYNTQAFSTFYYIASFSLIALFVFNLLVIGFGGLVEQKNEIQELILRFFVSIVLIINIRPFFQLLNETTDALVSLCAFNVTNGMNGAQMVANFFAGAISQTLMGILMIILIVSLLLEFIKLVMEIIERYIVVVLLHAAAPVAASFFVSRTTSSILSNYMRMYLSQLFLLIMNKLFIYLFVIAVRNSAFSTFIGCLTLITLLKCAQRIDSYMKSLGLNVAQTGNALAGAILGSVGTMAMALRTGRNAVSTTGKALEVAGAAKGDFGMARLGTKLRSGISSNESVQAAAYKTFAANGGLANTVTGDAKFNKAFMDMMSSGNYRTAAATPPRIQTSSIKAALNQNGIDAFLQATGFNASDITSAQVMQDGSIKGIVSNQADNGSLNRYGFVLSPNTIGGASTAMASPFGSGQMYASITPSKANNYSGMKFSNLNFDNYGDNISPITAVTGASIDNQQWSNLGVVAAEVNDNNVLIAQNTEGIGVAAINLDTGNSYDYGTASSPKNNERFSFYNEENVLDELDIKSMLPKDASVVENSFHVFNDSPSGYQANFDWKSNVASGRITIERPSPIDINRDSRSVIVNKGPAYGSFKISNIRKTQSETSVGR